MLKKLLESMAPKPKYTVTRLDEARRTKSEIVKDINDIEIKIHSKWKKGGTVPENDPLNIILRGLKAELKRSNMKVVGESVDLYQVGDVVETHIGGRWIKAKITKPPHKVTGNYGVRLKVGTTTINTVSSLEQLRKIAPVKESSESQYSNIDDWKQAVTDRGFVVRSAVHPKDGSDGNYWTAKDKQGNHKGHFDKTITNKTKGLIQETRDEEAALSGKEFPSNIDNTPKKSDPKDTSAKIDKLSSKLAMLKVKLSAANKLKNPDERVILGLENDVDITTGEIDILKKSITR